MIKINIAEETWKVIEEEHKKYVEEVILPHWNKLVGLQVNRQEVTKEEKDEIEDRLKKENIPINTDLFINSDILKYAYTSEALFGKNKAHVKRLVDILIYGFGYASKFSLVPKNEQETTWNRHKLLQMINIKVCPYCNRQYITSYQRENGTRWSTADIDHYFPKRTFPLLSMNIYNMIPSCSTCNSRLKQGRVKKMEDRHLYPYADETDSLRFSYDEHLLEKIWIGKETKEKLKLFLSNQGKEQDHRKRGEQSKEIFRLNEIYEVHNSDMISLIENYKHYDQWYYKNVQNENYPNLIKNYEELHNMIFDFLFKDEGEEPLVKMKKDIYMQLKK